MERNNMNLINAFYTPPNFPYREKQKSLALNDVSYVEHRHRFY